MAAPPDFLYWYRAKRLCVVDGYTIDVLTDLGFRYGWEQRVRLYGIDAYELNDPDAAMRCWRGLGTMVLEKSDSSERHKAGWAGGGRRGPLRSGPRGALGP